MLRAGFYDGELRQVTVIDLGHEEPTILLTNNKDITFVALVTRYAQRMTLRTALPKPSTSFISMRCPPWSA
jgi:hypothetical protein